MKTISTSCGSGWFKTNKSCFLRLLFPLTMLGSEDAGSEFCETLGLGKIQWFGVVYFCRSLELAEEFWKCYVPHPAALEGTI